MKAVDIQHARRTNPYPWTWELPAAATAAVLILMCLVVHAARAMANLCAGGGWHLTPRAALLSSLPELLGGNSMAGLPQNADSASSAGVLWVWIGLLELLLLLGLVLAVRTGLRRWGPGRIRGMASPGEAEQLLGLSRLRRNTPVIRPDLHGPDQHGPDLHDTGRRGCGMRDSGRPDVEELR